MSKPIVAIACLLFGGFLLSSTATIHAQTLLLSLQASNYNAATGVWTDSSSNADNATVSGTGGNPTLVTNDTPNGASAVHFSGSQKLSLATGIAAATNYTAFVFIKPSNTDGTMFSGSEGSFQYRVTGSTQDVVQEYQADAGHGTGTVSTTAFSSLNVVTGSSGTNYRLNGAADGTTSAVTFSSAITTIGNQGNGNATEFFSGDIADIEIYSGTLTTAQRMAVESQFNSEYVTVVPEPSTGCLMVGGLGLLLVVRRRSPRLA